MAVYNQQWEKKCTNKTKQRVWSTFHRDMLNRLRSTPGTRAYWINRHDRSKRLLCFAVCSVCLSKQTVRRKIFCFPLCSVWYVQKGFHMFPLKIICEVLSSSWNGPVMNLQLESQALNHCRIVLFFVFFAHHYVKMLCWLSDSSSSS